MKDLLYYLLQVIVASGILYGYYHFVLKNKKFHRYNRFYLLAAAAISILIPFLNIPVYFTNEEADSSFVLQTLRTISFTGFQETTVTALITDPVKTNWFTWENILYSFYILIAGLVFIRVIFSLRKIKSIIKRNLVEKIGNIHFVNTDEPGTPFSFFRWLFWNRKIELKSSKGEQIFRHELFHIEQKHSIDIVFTELLAVVFWINPFFHLIKKELKAIHEFLADEYAINENEKWEYAELLLMQVLNTKIHLTNPFFHNQIKRRISMITSSQKPKYRYLRKLLVLPIAAIVVILFAFSYRSKSMDKKNTNSFEKPIVDTVPKTRENKIFEKVEVESSFIGGQPAWRKFLERNLDPQVPVKNGAPAGTYTVWIQFIVDREGNISDLKALTNKGYGMEQEAIQAMKKSPKWEPPLQNGHKVKAYRKQPITFVVPQSDKSITDSPLLKKEVIPEKIQSDDNLVFEQVEKEPSFPGGEQGWRKYLEKI